MPARTLAGTRTLADARTLAATRTLAAARSPLWLPSDQGVALLAWYVADDVRVANSVAVDSWTDRSGNGNTLLGVTTGRPLMKTGILNGHAVVRFDGSNDKMDAAAAPAATALSGEDIPWTMLAVIKKTTNSSSDGVMALVATADLSTVAYHNVSTSSAGLYRSQRVADDTTDSGVLASVEVVDTNPHVLSTVFTGTAVSIYADGVVTSVNNTAMNTPVCTFGILRLGAVRASAFPFDGDIAELVLFAGALSDSIFGQATRYLGARYAITVS